MTSYILQTVFFQLLFLVAYEIFHKKDTFFSINRAYLIGTSILSLLLPWVQLRSIQEQIPESYVENIPEVLIQQTVTIPVLEIGNLAGTSNTNIFESINWWWVVYALGLSIMVFRFVSRLYRIHQLQKTATKSYVENLNLYVIPQSKDAFSFWKSIYIGDQIDDEGKKQILAHEIAHVKELHSADLLWFELLKLVFWFNPLVFVYQSKITTIHEYIADRISISLTSKHEYYLQLLKSTFNTEDIQFINQFFQKSLIKKRILMLQKSKSTKVSKLKYLSMLPIIGIMLVLASFSSLEKLSTDDTTLEENISESKDQESKLENALSSSTKENVEFPESQNLTPLENEKTNSAIEEQSQSAKNNPPLEQESVLTAAIPSERTPPGYYLIAKIVKDENLIYQSEKEIKDKGVAPEFFKNPTDKFTYMYLDRYNNLAIAKEKLSSKYDGKYNGELFILKVIDSKKPLQQTSETPNLSKEAVVLTENIYDVENNEGLNGYYLITNIIKKESFLNKALEMVQKKGVQAKYFKNPKDNYIYLYLDRYNTLDQAKEKLFSKYDGKYDGDMYILKIDTSKPSTKSKDSTNTPLQKEEKVLTEDLTSYGDTTVPKGYYLIVNIHKRESYLKKSIEKLKNLGLKGKYFVNPKDTYKYLYIEKYDTLDQAKEKLASKLDGKYKGDMYILKVK